MYLLTCPKRVVDEIRFLPIQLNVRLYVLLLTYALYVRLLVYFILRHAQEGGSSRDRPRRGELREREAGRIS